MAKELINALFGRHALPKNGRAGYTVMSKLYSEVYFKNLCYIDTDSIRKEKEQTNADHKQDAHELHLHIRDH